MWGVFGLSAPCSCLLILLPALAQKLGAMLSCVRHWGFYIFLKIYLLL